MITATMIFCHIPATSQNPISVPNWKTAVANENASRVLNTIENTPHFQDPLSLEIQTTETKQGA